MAYQFSISEQLKLAKMVNAIGKGQYADDCKPSIDTVCSIFNDGVDHPYPIKMARLPIVGNGPIELIS